MEIYIAKSGKEAGPFTKEQIAPMLESGMLTLTDSVWHKDLPGWIPVHQFLNVRPPIPVASSIFVSTVANDHPAPPVIRSGDPAPFDKRIIAHLIDTSICIIVTVVAYFILISLYNAFGFMESSSVLVTWLFITLYFMLAFLPTWFYHAWWESSVEQATPGKKANGLVVTDINKNRLSFAQASKRSMGKCVSQLFLFGVIFLTCLSSKKRQCLHDILANCLVVVK